jgi:regulator of sigma E protease
MLLTLIVFIIILGLLVFVHELGHFCVAKIFGLKPEEFGFGFPPRMLGRYKSTDGKWKTVSGSKPVEDAADTIYSANWLPLGGFVKLGEDDQPKPDENHFNNLSAWKRCLILLAGVSMNVVLAAVLISFGYMIGLPTVIDGGNVNDAIVSNERVQVVQVYPGSPAETAGLKVGDVVSEINGEAIQTSDKLQSLVAKNVNKKITFTITRGQEAIQKAITPEKRPESGEPGIGIGISNTALARYSFFVAIWEGIKTTIILVGAIVLAFFMMIKNLVMGNGVSADIAGPVGIAALTGQVTRMGFVYVLQFAAILSVNLAIINALPFPALDGGRILFLLIEKIKGSPVKKELEGTIHYIGFMILMLLVLLVTIKDVSRYLGFFKIVWDKIF